MEKLHAAVQRDPKSPCQPDNVTTVIAGRYYGPDEEEGLVKDSHDKSRLVPIAEAADTFDSLGNPNFGGSTLLPADVPIKLFMEGQNLLVSSLGRHCYEVQKAALSEKQGEAMPPSILSTNSDEGEDFDVSKESVKILRDLSDAAVGSSQGFDRSPVLLVVLATTVEGSLFSLCRRLSSQYGHRSVHGLLVRQPAAAAAASGVWRTSVHKGYAVPEEARIVVANGFVPVLNRRVAAVIGVGLPMAVGSDDLTASHLKVIQQWPIFLSAVRYDLVVVSRLINHQGKQ